MIMNVTFVTDAPAAIVKSGGVAASSRAAPGITEEKTDSTTYNNYRLDMPCMMITHTRMGAVSALW